LLAPQKTGLVQSKRAFSIHHSNGYCFAQINSCPIDMRENESHPASSKREKENAHEKDGQIDAPNI
jgi:hypothetical protein